MLQKRHAVWGCVPLLGHKQPPHQRRVIGTTADTGFMQLDFSLIVTSRGPAGAIGDEDWDEDWIVQVGFAAGAVQPAWFEAALKH